MGRWGSAILLASVILFANVQTRIINHIAKKVNMPYEVGQSASIVEKAKSKTANIPPEISTGTTTNTPPEISTGTTTTTPPEISTGTTTTTPPGTTMPPVNSSHLGFNFACPTDHFCEYTYVAPYYNRTWYNTEEKKYHNYASEFDNIEKIINSNFNESFTVYDDVTKQLNHLNETVMNITGLLNSIEKDQNNISAALDCMEYKLIQAQVFLDDVQTRVGSCFYQQCYLATSTATSTTTTTIPTTTRHCSKNCSSHSKSSSCTISNGRDYCECLGNLDGYQYCSTSSCGNVEISLDGNATGLPFWSPGYNGTATSPEYYYNNRFCTWTLTSQHGLSVTTADFTNMDPTSKLTFKDPNTGDIIAMATNRWKTSIRNINFILGSYDSVEIILDTGASDSPGEHYFRWTFDVN